jgi:multidrug resistance efflux pump
MDSRRTQILAEVRQGEEGMKITWLLVIVLVALTAVSGHLALKGKWDAGDSPRPQAPAYCPDQVAANGVVEGARPEVALRPEITGTIAAIYFRENQEVAKGNVLVELANETQKQQVALARAEVATAKAELERLQNGERPEKRTAVAALERAKRAFYLQAKADWERAQKSQSAISSEKRDLDHYRMLRAQAELEQATAEHALVEAPARVDEVAAAEGRVAAAEARLRLAEAELAKTCLTAPTAGRILRVYAEPGELACPASAQPILLLADLSKCCVRAFVEELDASRVRVGQCAVVTVDGLPDWEFAGTVAVVMPRMGKRAVQTEAPEEYKDLYYREVLIDLAPSDVLTVNLRVKTRIQVN